MNTTTAVLHRDVPLAFHHGLPLDEEDFVHPAVLKRVDAALDDFERTGLHVTLEEVKEWLAAVRINPNATRPVCHT